jgi:hypothetical protein
VDILQRELESKESAFEGCWGSENPTLDLYEFNFRVSGSILTLTMARAFDFTPRSHLQWRSDKFSSFFKKSIYFGLLGYPEEYMKTLEKMA